MKDKIKRLLGLDASSEYIERYFEASNAKASIFMSVIIILLEGWLIINLMYRLMFDPSFDRSSSWITAHFLSYIAVLASGCVALIYADKYRRGKVKRNKNRHSMTLWLFCCICILFGLFFSYTDFSNGEQIFTFISMVLFVVCLLVWKPILSFGLLSVSFFAMYLLMSRNATPSYSTKINFFILWISVLVTSISNYYQKRVEAEKDESVDAATTRIRQSAMVDEMTGVANMNFFRGRAAEMLNDIDNNPGSLIFLFLDIENFKAVNEKYGFESGNAFLKKIAGVMMEQFPEALIARQGDDHFVILTEEKGCLDKLEALRALIFNFDADLQIGLKAGGFIPKDRECDPHVACDNARYACESIKKKFDQDYCLYDTALSEEFKMKQYIVNNVDQALDSGHIKVHYQPVVWAKNRKLCGYEALVKWEDPNYGFISPGLFIPILEEYRQVHKVDMIVIDTVCRDIKSLLKSKRPAVPVSLNFSRLDFELTDVVDLIESCVQKHDIPRDMLHVEVTESALSEYIDTLQDDLDRLRKLGYPLWLDDFGSGYSSLNVLKDFSFDVMKIDMVFLSSFDNNKAKSMAVIKNVINLANDLGMRTLTEGVETIEEAEYLKDAGCERLQGYLFGKAMPLKEIMIKIGAGTLKVSEEYLNND
ncbi:MAG: EAL domain-containing protein [Saccharofermentans sp.]|nr:EAL domain-containing protein [Saccharofermentans sp.]